MPRTKVYTLDCVKIAILRRHGKDRCTVCHMKWLIGDVIRSGNGSSRWPKHENCCLSDSRPKTEVLLIVGAKN